MISNICSNLASLIKLRLSVLIALSTVWGLILQSGQLSWTTLLTFLSLLSLSFGASALNNYQDRHFDGEFTRTQSRPLVTGKFSSGFVLLIAVVCFCLGWIGLGLISADSLPVILSIIAVILYNLVYTGLKRKTVWAILPGAVCGALPLLIGWEIPPHASLNLSIGAILYLMTLWQMPHFWLIVLSNQQEHFQSRYPSMRSLFSEKQVKRILFVWILNYVGVICMLPLFFDFQFKITNLLILVVGVFQGVVFGVVLATSHSNYRLLFYLHMLLIFVLMLLISTDRLLTI